MTPLDYQSPQTAREQSSVPAPWLGWAIFLGMSWTWCIGMFLPVLLVRDYGPWAWVAFAIPNVVGAAAMGWILRDGSSERITSFHRTAITAFSCVTAGFQIFFALWMFNSLGRNELIVTTFVFAAVVMVGGLIRSALAVAAAIVALGVSAWIIFGADGGALGQLYDAAQSLPGRDVLYLTPVMLFGFLLCPYLDVTFHHARCQQRWEESRVVFTAGFALFFFPMIFLSLAYSSVVAGWNGVNRGMLASIPVYWSVQLALTIGYHWLFGSSKLISLDGPATRVGISALLGFGAYFVAARFGQRDTTGGETIYRLFMAFYGLVFPAYVYLCMLPTRGRVRPSSRSLGVFASVCILAAPMYWMGFIERKTWWLLPGVGIVLLARLFIRSHAPTPALAQSEPSPRTAD